MLENILHKVKMKGRRLNSLVFIYRATRGPIALLEKTLQKDTVKGRRLNSLERSPTGQQHCWKRCYS